MIMAKSTLLHLHGSEAILLLDKRFIVFVCAAHWTHADDHDEDHEDSGDQNTNDKPGLQHWWERKIRLIRKEQLEYIFTVLFVSKC